MTTSHLLRLLVVAIAALVALTIYSRYYPNATVGMIEGFWLLAGVYVTLLGFRFTGPLPGVNARYDDMYQKSIKWGRILGPLFIAKGLTFFAFGYRIPNDLIQSTIER